MCWNDAGMMVFAEQLAHSCTSWRLGCTLVGGLLNLRVAHAANQGPLLKRGTLSSLGVL